MADVPMIGGGTKESNFVLMLTMGPIQGNFRIYSEKALADVAMEIHAQAEHGVVKLTDPEDGSEICVLVPKTVPIVVKVMARRAFENAQAEARRAMARPGPQLVG